MASEALTQQTYLPAIGESDQLAEVHDFLAAHEVARGTRPSAQYFLSGPKAGDQVQLPAQVHAVLVKVVDAMQAGLAVTVAPQSQTLTSQQAADLLGVSRPTLVKFLDEGRIASERVGAHRRVKLRDVLVFREQRRREQYAALEATAVDLREEEDLDEVLASLKQARHELAEQRRSRARS